MSDERSNSCSPDLHFITCRGWLLFLLTKALSTKTHGRGLPALLANGRAQAGKFYLCLWMAGGWLGEEADCDIILKVALSIPRVHEEL